MRIVFAALAAAAAFGAAPRAAAATNVGALSRSPVPVDQRWKQHVVDPQQIDVYPQRVEIQGDTSAVDDPGGLTAPGGGATTIHASGAGAPRLILDLGVNTGGFVEVDVARGDGTKVRLAYSEQRAFLTETGDTLGTSLGSNDNPDGRYDTFAASDGLRFRSPAVRGGQRWVLLQLDGPGSVSIDAVRVHVTHMRATAADYAGHFLSNDDTLNRAWYASAYTYNASTTGDPPVVMDGAKRDRMVFTGDLGIAQLVGMNTVRAGAAVSRNSLWIFSCDQASTGFLPGSEDTTKRCPDDPPAPSGNGIPIRSGEYVAWYVVAAGDYDRLTGDHATVRKLLPVLRRAIGYLSAREQEGLYSASPTGGFEYNWRANQNYGASAYTNIVYYRALRGLADLERRIGSGPGAAVDLDRHADAVKAALMAQLWDAAVGAFRVNTLDTMPNHAQDANVQAVIAELLSPADAESALRFVKDKLATRYGTRNAELDGDPFVTQYISPFTTSWELQARFQQGDAAGALDLIRTLWGHMVDTDPKSTVWEKVALDGTPQPNYGGGQGLPTTRPEGEGYVSLAHAWSGGPVPALSNWVLGVRPVAPGFESWLVAPQPGDLRWAQGTVPTPRGAIASRWARGRGDRSFRLTVKAPVGTRGTVVVPLLGADRTIARDGKVVWNRGRAAAGARAQRDGDGVRFSARPGRHTYAWVAL